MGTSAPSKGSPPGVSFDPEWLEDIPVCGPTEVECGPLIEPDEAENPEEDIEEVDTGAMVAPNARNSAAKRSMGVFISNNTYAPEYLKKSLSGLVRRSLGGSRQATKRMRVTSAAASSLGAYLAAMRDGSDPDVNAWVESINQRGLSARDVVLELATMIFPAGGSTTEESAKNAIVEASIIFNERHQDIDILSLSNENILELMGLTIGIDVYNKINLELQVMFDNLNYSPIVIRERLNEVLDYVLTAVGNQLSEHDLTNMNKSNLLKISNRIMRQTFEVFEE